MSLTGIAVCLVLAMWVWKLEVDFALSDVKTNIL